MCPVYRSYELTRPPKPKSVRYLPRPDCLGDDSEFVVFLAEALPGSGQGKTPAILIWRGRGNRLVLIGGGI